MKIKSLVISALLFSSVLSFAQNVQLHYDFGKDRKLVTSTVEMFKPDKFGSTFFFIDMDYSSDTRGTDNGVSLAYWEIARSFKWNENQKFEPRIEFNAGNIFVAENFGFPINNAFLVGAQYTFNNADFSKILTIQANYKNIKDARTIEIDVKNQNSFQITAVWALHFLDNKLSLLGFADFWRQDSFEGEYIFLTEPQFWYNTCPNFSIGSEIEISSNFVDNGFVVNPTLAVKYTF
ncbi:DUF5020 family protein [Carboxylicivirga caseinilyticus]|uniref:DUF5020 family protein n=1 Tax=Carboxylicivirga caseinilyticus TaxID=3417572 RepID=UPI003D32ADA9|nr:DUF5020 family protein [Marinilabiliaceae bacterium A049]